MTKLVTKHMVVFAGLLAVPAGTSLSQNQKMTPVAPSKENPMLPAEDPRFPALKAFFEKYNCPIGEMVPEFLAAADENDLDWRLLPSISLIESGGGKAMTNNNAFGWGSNTQGFPS